ncbi:MAG: DegT/DnrJ/EryC1/StrS family aminotransferase [Chloroflexi bacterium]|nr:DegT/DnrJ/EryC1/StrS family aminotransferase [Chloroflexota bacterium]
MNIPLARPDITDLECRYVQEVLVTPHLSLGPRLLEFEKRLAEYAGVRHAVAVNSGTSGLHLIVKAMGLGLGDEVITTPFTFIASANCMLFERARPVFVDIEPETLNMDNNLVPAAITAHTRAILAVDVFGHPARWEQLLALASTHRLKLIEDAAEAMGSEYQGRRCGSFGDAAIYAFYPNKQMTTGEGGVVLTNDGTIAELCRSMRNQGRANGDGWLQHTRLGYNYRLSEINCALGIAQLERFEDMMRARSRVARLYDERLRDLKGVTVPRVAPGVKMSYFVYVVRLSEEYNREDRDRIIRSLKAKGIGCSDYFSPVHLQPIYRSLGYKEGDFTVAESVAARTIALPFYNQLREDEIDCVVSLLRELL